MALETSLGREPARASGTMKVQPLTSGTVKVARITVVLADDHAIVAEGLSAILKEKFDLLGTASDGRALVAAVESLGPDVAVTDIAMPELNGLDAVRQIKSLRPATKTIVLTMHTEPQL